MIARQNGYPFGFDPSACESCGGRCCNGESGHIWVSRQDIEAIARHLDMDTGAFIDDYLWKVGYRYSIKELKSNDNYACVFYDDRKGQCTIYDLRPEQCRTFPFWPRFKDAPREAFDECPGVLHLSEDS